MSRILIDGRFIGVGESMARYTMELLGHVLELDQVNQYTLLLRPVGENQKSKIKNQKNGNLSFKILDIPHFSIAEQTTLLNYLNKEKFDLVHFPQFNHPIRYHGKFIVTIHDLILLNHTKASLLKRLAVMPVLKSAARDSAQIITGSEVAKREIIYTLKAREDKIRLIYHGIDHSKFNLGAKSQKELLTKFLAKNKIEHDYLLYVGAWKSHKNIVRLLKAYEMYLKNNDRFVHLVLVGKVDKREKAVMQEIDRINKSRTPNSELRTSVIASGPTASDDELAAIYGGALAYITPSLAEGFGWPPLEAMACGTPVAASNASCTPEILGQAALLFDPLNVDETAQVIEKIINDHTLRESLIKKGLDQVKKYNWAETAKKTLEIYQEILKK